MQKVHKWVRAPRQLALQAGAFPGKLFKWLGLSLVSVCLGTPVYGVQEAAGVSQSVAPMYQLWFALRGGGGYLNSQDPNIENSKSGYNLGVRGLISTTSKLTQVNAGFGWNSARFIVPESKKRRIDQVEDLEVHTQYTVFDLTYTHFFSRHVALGPLLEVSFGTDTSFEPVPSSKGSRPNAYLGVAAYYYPGSSFPANSRLSLELMTAMTLAGRHVFFANLGYDLGVLIAGLQL